MPRTILSAAAAIVAMVGGVQGTVLVLAAEPAHVPPTANHAAVKSATESAGPGITTEKIAHDVVGRVVKVEELTGSGPPTEWRFEADEIRRVDVLESTTAQTEITLVIFMTSTSNRQADEDDVVRVSGKLLLHYERRRGQWMLKDVENLTFRYSVGVSI